MKKILAIVLAVALTGGLVGGGLYWKNSRSAKEINVYSVEELSTDYWGDSNESYGFVTADHTQSVYLSDTQTVREILVEEGQTVKKGDTLLTYDTTLSEVEVEKKRLSIQKLELELQKAKENLNKVRAYRPGVPVPEKNQVDTGVNFDDTALGYNEPETTAAVLYSGRGMVLRGSGWKNLSSMVLTGVLTPEETGSGEMTETETSGEDGTEEPSTEESSTEPSSSEKPEESSSEKPTESVSPSESTQESPSEPSTEETKPVIEPTDPEVPVEMPLLLGGRGTKKKPYAFEWTKSWTFDQTLLKHLSQGRRKAYVKLQPKTKEEEEESWWMIRILRDHEEYTFEMLQMCVNGMVIDLIPDEDPEDPTEETEDPEEPIEPDDPGWDDPAIDNSITYTAQEIAELLAEMNENVRDLDLEVRTAKIEYEKLKKEVNNGEVVSEIDGVIKTIRDQEEAKVNGESVINVSGGGGYYVNGSISELEMDTIHVGDTVNVMSYDTYESFEGTIQSIDDYPASGGYYNGSGNSNVSYYGFKVFIDESAELQDGSYCGLTYQAGETGSQNYYLMTSMIRSENGSSYVYVKNGDGKLEKRIIRTGKSLWGSYLEILEGLDRSEYVAFPYGTDLKEGLTAVEASTGDLYGY